MINKILKKTYRYFFPWNLPMPVHGQMSDKELNLVNELRQEFRTNEYFLSENLAKSGEEWTKNMIQLKELVLKNDPREFLKWDVIRYTMFVADAKYIKEEFNYLKNQFDFKSRWLHAIKENDFGSPNRHYHLAKSSGNLVHHAYHVANFEYKTKQNINNFDFIFEFGGGYGSMCRLFQNLNYNKKYLIYDLHPFSALQKYYLKSININVLDIESFLESESGILCISNIDNLRSILEKTNLENSLFIATWSFSETPLNFREQFLPLIKKMSSCLIAYQDGFQEVDNNSYFNNFTTYINNQKWYKSTIKHLPKDNYLFGQKI